MRILKGLILVGMVVVAVAYWFGARPKQEIDLEHLSTTNMAALTQAPQDFDPPMDAKGFTLRDKDGREVKLEQFKGKPILLNFWASWCPPCVDELPSFLKFAEWAKKSLGLVTLAVSVDENITAVETLFNEKKFWSLTALPLTILINPDSSVASNYGTTKFPETYFINRDFKIVRKFTGSQNWTSQEITEWITEKSK